MKSCCSMSREYGEVGVALLMTLHVMCTRMCVGLLEVLN